VIPGQALVMAIQGPEAAAIVSSLARSGGLMLAAPALASEAAPPLLKIFICLGLALAIAPHPVAGSLDAGGAATVLVLASEMLVGAVIGFGARVILSAAEGAGDLIGYQTGMSMSQVLDPLTNQSLNPIALLEGTVATQVFIAAGGIGFMAIALARSYAVVPAMSLVHPAAAGIRIASLGAWVVEGSLLLVAPAILAGLLLDLLMLVVARTAPALQLIAVALPAKVLVGMIVLAAVTSRHAPALASLADRARSEIEAILHALAPLTS